MVPTVQPRLSPRFEPAQQEGMLNAPPPLRTLSDETALDATIMEDGGHLPHRTTRPPANQQVTLITPVASGEDELIASAPHQKITAPTADLSTRPTTGAGVVPLTEEMLTPLPQQESRPLLAPQLHTIRPVWPTTAQQMRVDSAVNGANAVKADMTQTRATVQSSDEETADVQHDGRSRTNVQEQRASQDMVHKKVRPEEQTISSSQVVNASMLDLSTQLSPLSRIIAQPRIRPMSPERSDEGRGRSTKAAEPVASTIQVTIGRIEIRAEQTKASATAKPRGAPPVMSLDEYLRNRGNGGGR